MKRGLDSSTAGAGATTATTHAIDSHIS
jgi:hypothetical protein